MNDNENIIKLAENLDQCAKELVVLTNIVSELEQRIQRLEEVDHGLRQ